MEKGEQSQVHCAPPSVKASEQELVLRLDCWHLCEYGELKSLNEGLAEVFKSQHIPDGDIWEIVEVGTGQHGVENTDQFVPVSVCMKMIFYFAIWHWITTDSSFFRSILNIACSPDKRLKRNT
jgi:hypothetical protein